MQGHRAKISTLGVPNGRRPRRGDFTRSWSRWVIEFGLRTHAGPCDVIVSLCKACRSNALPIVYFTKYARHCNDQVVKSKFGVNVRSCEGKKANFNMNSIIKFFYDD